jgi:hypothetical protein
MPCRDWKAPQSVAENAGKSGLHEPRYKIPGSRRLGGGHDRDRTCDPYHVKVVLSR